MWGWTMTEVWRVISLKTEVMLPTLKLKKKKEGLAWIVFMQIGVLFSSLCIKSEYIWAWALEGCRLKTDLALFNQSLSYLRIATPQILLPSDLKRRRVDNWLFLIIELQFPALVLLL